MSVDKPLRTPDQVLSEREDEEFEDVEFEVVDFDDQDEILDELGVTRENADGSVEISFGEPDNPDADMEDFSANLAETLPESTLNLLAAESHKNYEDDLNSRKEWEEMMQRGLQLLGMATETRNDPWPNACGVYHPMLLEAVVRFWAKSSKDLAPPAGPAKANTKANASKEDEKRAIRVKEEINGIITKRIPDYADEQSRMAFMLGLTGCGFKKIYYNPATQEIEDRFVHPSDLIAPYGTTNLDRCPAFCHRQEMFPGEIRALQLSGFYRDIKLPDPVKSMKDEIRKEEDRTAGQSEPAVARQHRILEFHTDLQLEDDVLAPEDRAVPYIVIVDDSSQKVLAVYRNWKESDPKYKKIKHFVSYQYIPGYSIYSVGLVHIIGGLAEGATSILRQLVDAGTLANLPAGFKGRGFRVDNDDQPLRPGEWRDVDYPGHSLKDSMMPLPFKEPSNVLATLLTGIIEEGRRVGSVADVAASDVGKEAPVGTVLAILEETMVIQSSVQSNMLRSLTEEIFLIKEIAGEMLDAEYEYVTVDEGVSRSEDFLAEESICPVADPNASSMAQKVVAFQTVIDISQREGNLYNKSELHRGFLEALSIPNADKIVPVEDDIMPCDPVSENMKMMKGDPVKVFDDQNHEAHLQVHLAAMNDPMIMRVIGQFPNAQEIMGSVHAHITEHVAYAYRARVEAQLGQALPRTSQPFPPEMERAMAPQIAQAAQLVLQQDQAQAAQLQAEEQERDPVYKLQEREVGVKEQEVQRKWAETAGKLELEKDKIDIQAKTKMLEILAEFEAMKQDEKNRLIQLIFDAKELDTNAALGILQAKVQRDVANNRPKKSD